jgi:hypothetical protein
MWEIGAEDKHRQTVGSNETNGNQLKIHVSCTCCKIVIRPFALLFISLKNEGLRCRKYDIPLSSVMLYSYVIRNRGLCKESLEVCVEMESNSKVMDDEEG